MPNILHVKRNFYQDDFSITKGITRPCYRGKNSTVLFKGYSNTFFKKMAFGRTFALNSKSQGWADIFESFSLGLKTTERHWTDFSSFGTMTEYGALIVIGDIFYFFIF